MDGGIRGLVTGQRKWPASSGRCLSAEQEVQIQRLTEDHRSEPLKMDCALCTRAAVMLLMERECGMGIPVPSVGKYLKRCGFMPQKPIRRAHEQSPVAVQS